MKYKVKSFRHSENDWEAQYIEPPKEGVGNLIFTGNPVRLDKHFKSKKGADDYTIESLRKKGVADKEIEVRADFAS